MTTSRDHEESECFSIGGMHCRSCEIKLERAIKQLPGVTAVEAKHGAGTVRVTRAAGGASDHQIEAAIRAQGYGAGEGSASNRSWGIVVLSVALALALLWLLNLAHLTSLAPAAQQGLSLSGALLIGLVAGTSSCLAVVGGLVLALANRDAGAGDRTAMQRLEPLLQFNVGRLLAYFVLGGGIGLVGRSVGLDITSTAVVTLVVALLMLWLGLSQLGITAHLPLPSLPKSLSHRIAALSESPHPAAPFLLGAGTFFLPCGFTQSMQLVALASGSFMTGGILMFFFALGTLPALMGLSVLSSLASGRSAVLLKTTTGALVVFLALLNLQSGLTLLGAPADLPFLRHSDGVLAELHPGEQDISMTVTPYGTYEPSVLTVRAGIPVKWTIDGTNAAGCTNGIVVPALGINQELRRGENVITFTPLQPGTLAFSCTMGMVRGAFHVI